MLIYAPAYLRSLLPYLIQLLPLRLMPYHVFVLALHAIKTTLQPPPPPAHPPARCKIRNDAHTPLRNASREAEGALGLLAAIHGFGSTSKMWIAL